MPMQGQNDETYEDRLRRGELALVAALSGS